MLRPLEVAESPWNWRRNQYGGMKAGKAKRLKQLERENSRLKKLLAGAGLDKATLKELVEDAPIDCQVVMARKSARRAGKTSRAR